ncbi:MAG: VRR-NUC domain-containing protein [Acidaminococcaceae bacterium]|nr:VRR-NUC domain-containing protein [Acidaminococcaceae bacterium]MBQ6777973.1 VRR-NUC domain-containing protein [Acidaminococcaceae bacterium]
MVDSEKRVEALLVSGVKQMGGVAYKFVSPGNSGVPDRIILMPGGKIYFVELKREGGQLTNLQKRQINRIQKLDCQVDVLHGLAEVSNFLLRLQKDQQEGGDAL